MLEATNVSLSCLCDSGVLETASATTPHTHHITAAKKEENLRPLTYFMLLAADKVLQLLGSPSIHPDSLRRQARSLLLSQIPGDSLKCHATDDAAVNGGRVNAGTRICRPMS